VYLINVNYLSSIWGLGCLIIFSFNEPVFAQNPSTMLDFAANKKGILITRMSLTSTTDISTIASLATSLLVYNTTTVGIPPKNVSPAYYLEWNKMDSFRQYHKLCRVLCTHARRQYCYNSSRLTHRISSGWHNKWHHYTHQFQSI